MSVVGGGGGASMHTRHAGSQPSPFG